MPEVAPVSCPKWPWCHSRSFYRESREGERGKTGFPLTTGGNDRGVAAGMTEGAGGNDRGGAGGNDRGGLLCF